MKEIVSQELLKNRIRAFERKQWSRNESEKASRKEKKKQSGKGVKLRAKSGQGMEKGMNERINDW